MRILTPNHIATGRTRNNDLVPLLHGAIERANILLGALTRALDVSAVEGRHATADLRRGNDTNLIACQHLDCRRADIRVIVVDRAGVEAQDFPILPVRRWTMTSKP